ncbi:MAG: DUF4179 domain-containing protein [Oscillospiraceae bacterium]|jgi:hypothetical protein
MRSTEERVAAVKQRAKEMERQKQMRRSRGAVILSVAACLLFIITLAFAMPGIMADLPGGSYAYAGAAAGVFDGSGGFGYVLVGLLAFVLGVSVTILCYRIRLRNRRSLGDAEDSNG